MNKKYDVITEMDFIKAISILAVIWQGLLGTVIKEPLSFQQKQVVIVIYNLVKFSAPAFIFAICFDLSKSKERVYNKHLFNKLREIIIPYLIWTTIYYIIIGNSDNIIITYIFGTAAPHLWYTVMMFQFQLLVPLVWDLYDKISEDKKKLLRILLCSILIYIIWIFIYNKYIFQKVENIFLVFTDRSFISYFIYAILGCIASAKYKTLKNIIVTKKIYIVIFFIISFIMVNSIVLKRDIETITLQSITYINIFMFLYNIAMILLLFLAAIYFIRKSKELIKIVKFISKYAFRAYLANVLCFNFIYYLLNKSGLEINFNIKMLVLFCLTAVCSFLFIYILDICKNKIVIVYKLALSNKLEYKA